MVKVPIVNLYKYKFLKFSSIFKASPYDNGDKTLIFHYQLPIYIYIFLMHHTDVYIHV